MNDWDVRGLANWQFAVLLCGILLLLRLVCIPVERWLAGRALRRATLLQPLRRGAAYAVSRADTAPKPR